MAAGVSGFNMVKFFLGKMVLSPKLLRLTSLAAAFRELHGGIVTTCATPRLRAMGPETSLLVPCLVPVRLAFAAAFSAEAEAVAYQRRHGSKRV